MAIERSIFVTLEMICSFTSREKNVNFTKVIYGHGSCLVVFSHDVTVAILVSQNNPVGVELFSYANAFFCFNKFA